MAKTISEIIESMKVAISRDFPNLDMSEGEILHDVVLRAPAAELANMYSILESIANNQSILTANEVALEKHANNVGLKRKGPRAATGRITFYRASAPTTNLTIPKGTKVSTLSRENAVRVQFMTLQDVTMYFLQANTYFNASNNRYEITTDIECTQAGTSGVVGAGTIIEFNTGSLGIDGCTNNTATSGGLDIESKESLIQRIQNKWQGVNLGTKSGLLSKVLEDLRVEDANIVANGETGREEYGVVDIYVKGNVVRSKIDVFTSYNTNLEDFRFTKQPVKSITYVNSALGGIVHSTYYEILEDENSLRGSISGLDMLHWIVTMPNASYGTISTSYVYNGLIEDLQNVFNQSANDLINTSVLIKEAKPIEIDLEVNVTVVSDQGYVLSEVQSDVQTSLAIFFNSKKISEEVQQADVAYAILQTDGVDDLAIPFVTFESSDGSITVNASNNLVIPVNSYAVAGTITVNVSF